jgi:hypothetical protein
MLVRIHVVPLAVLLCVSASISAETRKFAFAGDAPAYQFSCGECGGYPYDVRAKVEGTFEVSLDFDQRKGTLLSLDAHLVNAEGGFGPDGWQPIYWQSEFLGTDRFDDRYRPPFPGVLQPADFRPLGPGTRTAAHFDPYIGLPSSQIPQPIPLWLDQGVGFEVAPANSWLLSFNGALPSPDGMTISIVASYNIYLEGNFAWLTYYIPIIDAVPSIAAAVAVQIPEPALLISAITALAMFMGIRRR